MKTILILIITVIIFSSCEKKFEIYDLSIENLTNPIGLETNEPRFSWKLKSNERGVFQEAYQIIVSSSRENLEQEIGDLWDTGKMLSDETILIKYAGKTLKSRQECFWKLKVWTNIGMASSKSDNMWSMGLSTSDWHGEWIGSSKVMDGDDLKSNFIPKDEDDRRLNSETRLRARYLRKEFAVDKEIEKATLYISGLGLYEAYFNGKKVGNQVLAPTPTDYSKSVPYNTFDVTDFIQKGENAFGVILGNGRFFSMRIPWCRTFGVPQLLTQLEIYYKNGSKDEIVSDESWKITVNGPIGSNNEFDGEEYDARKEMPGWNKSGFDDSNWDSVEIVYAPAGKIIAQENPNIKIMDNVKPLSINKIGEDKYIIDMGQNLVGWISMKVKGKAGDIVKLRFAESLKEDGNLFMDNLRGAKVTDLYTLKGGKEEFWEPSFVYHGFRYVEVTGYPNEPKLSDFEGKVVYDEMETTGSFETSNKLLNQIYSNSFWGIRGNYRGMPTDCPQRDERMGWLGDRSAGSYGESFIFDNQKLYVKWLQDIEESQKLDGALPDVAPNYWEMYTDDVTWPSAYFIIADMLLNQYGNRKPIEMHYDSFKKFMFFIQSNYMSNFIVTNDTFGDWCMPPESLEMILSEDPARKTDGELLATAFYYRLCVLMQKFATITNNNEDVEYYYELGESIKEAFNNKFYNEAEINYSNNTVTANLLAIMHEIAPEEIRADVFKHIASKIEVEFNGHVSTGLIGIQWLMRGLSEYGREDLAYKIASNKTYPSWGYMIENDATTIWELWNGNTADPEMNSGNHVMLLGDLIIWFYENLAGIKTSSDNIAFKQIEMNPFFVGDISYVKATYNSVRGLIKSHWKKTAVDYTWNITIPANTTAIIYLPDTKGKKVLESGKELITIKHTTKIKENNNNTVMTLESGNYIFQVR